MKIAYTLPEKLALINAASAAGKTLQINKDGGLQYESFRGKIVRLLGDIGQSESWRQERIAQQNERIKASLEDSVKVDGAPGSGKYDKLFQNIRLAGELSGRGQIVTQHYRAALDKFDQKSGLTPFESQVATEPSPQIASKTPFRPLHDVRLSLSARAESDNTIASLGKSGNLLRGSYEDYRALGEMPFSADREVRAEEAGRLLSALTTLENRLDELIQAGRFSAEQLESANQFLKRIEGEKSLIGGVIANTNPIGNDHGCSWNDAIALRRLGIDLGDEILHPRQIQSSTVAILGKGAMNEVFSVIDQSGDQFVYKPGQVLQKSLSADVLIFAAAHGADITETGSRAGVDLRFESRNIVASLLDRHAGTSLVVESYLAKVPVSKFTFKDEDVSERGDLHSDFGLLMKKAAGATGSSLAGTTELAKILPSRELKRDLSTLVLFDAILQSFDRHPGNYMIDIQNGNYAGLKAIDNDFAIFATDIPADQFRKHTDADRDVLIGRIPSSFKTDHKAGYMAMCNRARLMADVFDGFIQKSYTSDPDTPFPPTITISPEDRAKIASAIDRFDSAKAVYNKTKSTSVSVSPELKSAFDVFAAEIETAGFNEDSPIGLFVKDCKIVTEYVSTIESRREELKARLEAEGLILSSNGSYVNTTHNVGLPEIADKVIADRIRSADFEKALIESSQNLLTREELTALSDRLHKVQSHLDKLESQGRLVADPTWQTDIHDQDGNGIDELVGRSGHSYWPVLVQFHNERLAQNQPSPAAP